MDAHDHILNGRMSFEEMFVVEETGRDTFRSVHTDGRKRRVFGGQLLGQALTACLKTVDEDRPAHSFQIQFRQAGESDLPFDFTVERTSDGRSFSSRQIRVTQGGTLVLLAMASFHVPEEGLSYQHVMPDAPDPDTLQSEQDRRAEAFRAAGGDEAKVHALRHLGYEVRPSVAQDVLAPKVLPPYQRFWVRPVPKVTADRAMGQSMIAYLTDVMFLSTVLHVHGKHWLSTPMHWASLNHSLWLHAQPDFDDWMLWSTEAVWTGGARGLARGSVYNRNGLLVASASQEGLMRIRG